MVSVARKDKGTRGRHAINKEAQNYCRVEYDGLACKACVRVLSGKQAKARDASEMAAFFFTSSRLFT